MLTRPVPEFQGWTPAAVSVPVWFSAACTCNQRYKRDDSNDFHFSSPSSDSFMYLHVARGGRRDVRAQAPQCFDISIQVGHYQTRRYSNLTTIPSRRRFRSADAVICVPAGRRDAPGTARLSFSASLTRQAGRFGKSSYAIATPRP